MPEETFTREVLIPFDGFCDTEHGGFMDDAIEFEYEHASSEGIPPGVEDYEADMPGFMADYAEQFVAMLEEELNRDWLVEDDRKFSIKFLRVESPREYNFTNDNIIGEMSLHDVSRLFMLVDCAKLARIVKRDFTSRSGFASFYSRELNDWLVKPLEEWDCVMLGSLLEAFVEDYVGEALPLGHEIASEHVDRVEKEDD